MVIERNNSNSNHNNNGTSGGNAFVLKRPITALMTDRSHANGNQISVIEGNDYPQPA